jgi:hypothetical protein
VLPDAGDWVAEQLPICRRFFVGTRAASDYGVGRMSNGLRAGAVVFPHGRDLPPIIIFLRGGKEIALWAVTP